MGFFPMRMLGPAICRVSPTNQRIRHLYNASFPYTQDCHLAIKKCGENRALCGVSCCKGLFQLKHIPLTASQENSSSSQNLQLVRLPRVLALTGVSTATWYRGISSGIYPAPVKIGSRAVAWRMADLMPILENGVQGVADGSK